MMKDYFERLYYNTSYLTMHLRSMVEDIAQNIVQWRYIY